ncbi:hypothetical protein QTH87_07195 [Variovorax sp. J22P168]|uniref:hypothetical protein n=1 Tax=Variovorax jilinensis TaxID=3053513 RepID=UPI002575CE89|nr:hypothetical protein [Variovorax sp. J22P168]MDM0012221.1 hypothetical protein [Variovorax sp. J22P168]
MSLVLAFAATGAWAADLELQGSRLIVSGVLDGSAVKEFEARLAGGHVRTVVFENALGGSAEVAEVFARAIRNAGVNTEAKGQCQAACAFAFLAGKEHRFGHGFQVHALLIPVQGKPQPGELASRWRGDDANRTLAEFIEPAGTHAPMSEGAAPSALMPAVEGTPAATPSAARDRWQPNQGVLFTSTPTLFGRVSNSFYCDGTQGRDLSRCELLSDADPVKLGVLTP